MKFRTEFGKLNSFVLDSLYGLDETIQYQQSAKRADEMQKRSDGLAGMQKKLSEMEGSQRSVTNLVILIASFGMLFLTLNLYGHALPNHKKASMDKMSGYYTASFDTNNSTDKAS